jgi:hypothetical protein
MQPNIPCMHFCTGKIDLPATFFPDTAIIFAKISTPSNAEDFITCGNANVFIQG